METPSIADIEQAMMELVANDSTIRGYKKTVATLSQRNLKDDRLVAVHPAFLFYLEETRLAARTPNTYNYPMVFTILCLQKNLRGPEAEKFGGLPGEVGIYQMLADLKRVLAGARLDIPGVSSKPEVKLLGERLEEMSDQGLLASLKVSVETDYQNL